MVICHDCEDALAVLDWDRGEDYARWMGQSTRYVPVCDTCFRARDNADGEPLSFDEALAKQGERAELLEIARRLK